MKGKTKKSSWQPSLLTSPSIFGRAAVSTNVVTNTAMQASRLPVLVLPPSPLSWKNCMQYCTITQNKYRKGGGRVGWRAERSSGLHQWKAFHKNCYRVKSLQWFQFHLLAANQKTDTVRWPLRLQMNINSLATGIAYIPFLVGFSFSFFLLLFQGGKEWEKAKNIF